MPRYPIYYDTETTGVRPDKDRIIEIAAFNPETQKTFCEFIHPQIPIPPEASSVHHITDDMVKDSHPFSIVGQKFIDFCGPDAVLIAHNNDSFDRLFLEQECLRHSLSLPKWEYVDSLKWSRKYRPDLPKHALQFLRETYQVEANQAHRALDDVIILYKVFSLMIDDLSIDTVLELMQTPSVLQKMPFGKHQGKPLQEVPKSYVQWLAQSGAFEKPNNAELMQAFEHLGMLVR